MIKHWMLGIVVLGGSLMSVFAFTPTPELQTKLGTVVTVFETMIENKGEGYRNTIINVLGTFTTNSKYSANERVQYIVSYLQTALTLDEAEAVVVDSIGEDAAMTDIAKIEAFFEDDALVDEITVVDCTLSDGTATTCYKIVATQGITEDEIGPRCPRNITDTDEAGGIWLDGGEVHAVDGDFIKNLAIFYNDDARQLYDAATGEINVTDTKEAFEGAAKPQVEEQYKNHCVEGLLSYVDGIPVETYYLPTDPQKASTTQQANNQNPLGLAFNGIRIEAPAPLANILAANTIAAFDDCGGHVNPNVGYHYHAETGCAPRIASEDPTHVDLIGFALDGFEIYEHDETLADLDTCGGHDDETLGYHYHIAHAGENQQLGCFSGGYGCVLSEDGTCDASASDDRRGPPPGGTGGPPDRG